ncbi:phospholipase A [Psychromonas algicola]|uniref:phospholipase A n=1 Tax=Psychromonas algicola TaxID=2555642 RepID=UPI001067B867|nr:phospholipase A [Psychromonas sp. RZ5]TEW52223.1 phospholipase [Psychromonas sp. RZ5]
MFFKIKKIHFIFWTILFFSPTAFSEISAFDQFSSGESTAQFPMLPHKPTYLLPFNFNEKIQDYLVYQDENGITPAQSTEIKYQVSFKVPMFSRIGDFPLSAYIAYTQVSFWQAYNSDFSSPFRETNYEPETFLYWQPYNEYSFLGTDWIIKRFSLGLVHQSNGLSLPDSRSWNRSYAGAVFENNNFYIAGKYWRRLDDSEDNNPDILDYYGNGTISFAYSKDGHTFSITSRNNIQSRFTKGSVSLSWSFPVLGSFKGYIQAFSGYGNSLIEYNVHTNTIGIGISVIDFL